MNIVEKIQKSWIELFKFPFESGLGRILLFGFLAISLVPLTVVSFVSYRISYNSLKDDAMNSLSAVAEIKKDYVASYFAERLKDVSLQAQLDFNIKTLELLKGYLVKSGMSVDEFVKSDKWKMTIDERCKDLKLVKNTYNYVDLFFIDNEGNVLFTVASNNDLGTNIFSGKYSNTLFGKACRKAFTTRKAVFSDFAFYEPAGNSVVGFFIRAVVNDKGEKIGLLANSIPVDDIDAILQERTGLGSTGESYLVGKDLTMRTNSRFQSESTILKKIIDTTVTREWIKQTRGNGKGFGRQIKASTYSDYRGVDVLGTFSGMEVAGVNLALVVEIDEAEAFGPVKMLQKVVIGLLFVTVIVVILISVVVTKYFVVPIKRVAYWGHRVALRDLSPSEEVEIVNQIPISGNEIGQVGKSFKEIVESFDELSKVCEAVSIGDFHKHVKIVSENDRLGKAVNQMADNLHSVVDQVNSVAKGDYSVEIVPLSDHDHLGTALLEMATALKKVSAENEKKIWLRNHRMELNDMMRGELDVKALCQNVINYFADCINSQIGAIYLSNKEDDVLKLVASFAYTERKNLSNEFKVGEGLVGQAALEKQTIVISNVPDDYIKINSGLGEAVPHYIIVMPFLYENSVVGVVELGAFHEFTEIQLEFLNLVIENIAIAINSAESRTLMEKLLEETQLQAMKLETQQEELRQTNEELSEQAKTLQKSEEQLRVEQEELRQTNEELSEQTGTLKKSEEDLKVQQEELQQTNEELEERTEELEKQKDDIKQKNQDLEESKSELKTKADDLELTSK
ncbi:MAG: GAF domain-containing protein, partial [Candidatus Anammoxibacter sp.]